MKRRQLLALGASVFVFIAVLAYLFASAGRSGPPGAPPGVGQGRPAQAAAGSAHRPLKPAATDQRQQSPQVSVLTVSSQTYVGRVQGYGAVEPRYALKLQARVSGYIDRLDAAFESGRRVAAGALLAKLEDSDYRSALAAAELDLANARTVLLEEERQSEQARAEWEIAGLGGDASELVLREPQLQAARASLEKARTALNSAQKNLDNTAVTAPFDALIVNRTVSPGSFVQAGAEIGSLYSTEQVEIAVSLAAADWRVLPDEKQLISGEWPVRVSSRDEHSQWQGYVQRVERHLDASTRQRTLIVAVDRPLDQTPALLPGTFVELQISGKATDNLWQLPSTALSQRGEVWYLDADNRLRTFAAQVRFSKGAFIYIEAPAALAPAPQKVLTRPLNSYVEGMRVQPIEEPDNAQ